MQRFPMQRLAMRSVPHLAAALVLALQPACFSIAYNPGVSATLPFHPHHALLMEAAPVEATPLAPRTPAVPLSLRPFVPYYARPYGLQILNVEDPAARAWQPLPKDAVEPELQLTQAFARALPPGKPAKGAPVKGAPVKGAALQLQGVVTELVFYRWGGGSGGVVTTQLSVVDAQGQVVAEQQQRTVGKADDLAQLLDAHVRRCLTDPQLAGALWPAGGAP